MIVTKLTQIFNAEDILSCLPNIAALQLAITHSIYNESFEDGIGSLYDVELNMFTKQTAMYTIMNKYFEDTYLEDVIWNVRRQAVTDKVSLGRIRVMTLESNTCYGLHSDTEPFRYHIPLITNDACFFINGDIVSHMPEAGQLYKYSTSDAHTAVNASSCKRVHLVFDTFI